MRKIVLIAALAVALLGGNHAGRAANNPGWSVAAFSGSSISLVRVNKYHPVEVAVVAAGVLQLTRDAGLTWHSASVPVMVRQLEYDPAVIDRIYAGTDAGVYVSDDAGGHWRLLDTGLSARKITEAMVATDRYLFAAMFDGAGTPQSLFRYGRDGSIGTLSVPGSSPASLDYDADQHRLYLAGLDGVYLSENDGATWRLSGGGRSGETVVAKGATIWETAADGLYRSVDNGGSWVRLARSGDLNGTYYGSDMRTSGLAVNNGRAFYGAWSIGFPYKFLAEYSGTAAHSEIDGRVYSVATSGTRIWVGTASGLWINDQVVTTEVRQQRPVIVIPGVLGSMPVPLGMASAFGGYLPEPIGANYHTDLVLDPISKTYDGLISGLAAAGYQRGSSLFSFPYEWRHDNAQSGRELAVRIADVRRACGCAQVDLVAHSMGGLVARSYIESSSYAGDVHALVQIGTPNSGSPSAYAGWEAGVINDSHSLTDHLANTVFKIEAAHAGYGSLVEYIRARVLSVGQLLPVYNYIAGRVYPTGYPRNSFLETLNLASGLQQLKQRVVFSVIGSSNQTTVTGLTLGPAKPGAIQWPDGEISAKATGSGDGTVPLESAQSVAAISRYVGGSHGEIVGSADTISYINSNLLGGYVDAAATDSLRPAKYLVFYAQSPISLAVSDMAGRVLSDNQNTIPGAYYSGSAAATQIAVLPSPAGDYRIQISGTDAGQYTVGSNLIDLVAGTTIPSSLSATIKTGQSRNYMWQGSTRSIIGTDPPAAMAASASPPWSTAAAAIAPSSLASDYVWYSLPAVAIAGQSLNYHRPNNLLGRARPHPLLSRPIAGKITPLVTSILMIMLAVAAYQLYRHSRR